MGAVRLPGAVADPEHVGRGVVPVAGQAVLPRHRLLVGQQQRLVGGEEACLTHVRAGVGVDAARLHEPERGVDMVGQFLIALAGRTVGDEILRPAVHLVQVGIAAQGEGAQQVEGRGRLEIGLHHAARIRHARRFLEVDAVDDVAAVGRQGRVALGFGVRRARLGELAGQPAHLHHRRARGIHQHHGHLEQHLEGVADVVRMEFGKALRAVAALQQKGLALRGERKLVGQRPRLAGEDQRRIAGQLRLGGRDGRGIRIGRHLHGGLVPPACRAPVRHGCNPVKRL